MKSLFYIEGKVREGKKRGKGLGFPTVNIAVNMAIPEGIYISQTVINNKTYHSLTFIGAARTYNEEEFQAETFIFDFNQDIYGETIRIDLLKKIRDNHKFDTEKELVKQMEKDKQMAEEYFSH